jgi:antitoxin CcdA
MKHDRISAKTRKAVNLSIDAELVSNAKAMGINLSQTCEAALSAALKKEREEQWIKENWDAIQATNAWVEKNGLPLAKYRVF